MSDTLKPTISPLQLRDELEAMVLKELLGPGSAEEEIIESPGTRYFVGVLAPASEPGGRCRGPGCRRTAAAHRGRGRRGGRRDHGWRRTGPRWPGHDPGRYAPLQPRDRTKP